VRNIIAINMSEEAQITRLLKKWDGKLEAGKVV
jgi:hypothetical protein